MTNIEKLFATKLKEGLTPYRLAYITCGMMESCLGCPMDGGCRGCNYSVSEISEWAMKEAEVTDDQH